MYLSHFAEMGRQLQTHLLFRTTSIYPLVSAPKGIRRILHGPRYTVKEKTRWRERWLGGEVTRVPSLAWGGRRGRGLLGPSPLSGGDPRGGASPWATGTGEGRTRWRGCVQKLSVLERNSAGKTVLPTAPSRASLGPSPTPARTPSPCDPGSRVPAVATAP